MSDSLEKLHSRLIKCRKCPRLVGYLASIRKKFPGYWCRPVPGFGDPKAKILILGLAPGRFGANRTGRMFTGDASGRFLYQTLFDVGLANQAVSLGPWDRLRLKNVYITAALRCAPPQNKPRPQELKNCAPYLEEEMKLLPKIQVVVALGQIAHLAYLRFLRKRLKFSLTRFPFRHGAKYKIPGDTRLLLDSYHPSRQNTQTGKLTPAQLRKVFQDAKSLSFSQKDFLP